ncbi:MAG: TlpA disulfide reductase family protein [Bacteroidota bacterium]
MNKKNLIFLAAFILIWFAWRWYRMPHVRAGETVPDFQATLVTGEQMHFSDLKGKYVLLQFWGSWCGPCRRENPQLLALYNKYHDKGFEIFSVGVESNPQQWKNAMQHDGMIWKYHTSELQSFDGAIPKQFNIKSIPTTILVNNDGTIMGVDLDPDQIGKRLATALTK